jgi:hypothetical protein
LLARSIFPAQLIVCGALFRILEYFVGFLNVLELLLGVPFLADVGMVLASLFPICALDFLRIGAARYTEGFVIVLELHALT